MTTVTATRTFCSATWPSDFEHERRWVGALIDADLPKRFIWGPEDPVSGAHVVHELQARLPGARVEVLAGVGHAPHMEVPERVAPLLAGVA